MEFWSKNTCPEPVYKREIPYPECIVIGIASENDLNIIKENWDREISK
ncbi:hypothetical protein OOZ15_00230 [Galbibacter sp. EGI 63066]|nr:hypothetical protein [Galbibacter sp. EGI 63066]MCX2678356.1 hypothetical protein [Galbibacter sp. EGI 63066]